MTEKKTAYDELPDGIKTFFAIMIGPLAAVLALAFALLGLGVAFVEAWVALQVWQWHVPYTLPSWMNWWTLGWANAIVSLMIRQTSAHFYMKDDVLKSQWSRFMTQMQHAFVLPFVLLALGWLFHIAGY